MGLRGCTARRTTDELTWTWGELQDALLSLFNDDNTLVLNKHHNQWCLFLVKPVLRSASSTSLVWTVIITYNRVQNSIKITKLILIEKSTMWRHIICKLLLHCSKPVILDQWSTHQCHDWLHDHLKNRAGYLQNSIHRLKGTNTSVLPCFESCNTVHYFQHRC